ncbi:hypothetical protein GH876_29740 [Bacillus thuringiensis]|nr:hypothetical protein [Bacillus thuringiensis]MRC50104.1 hypothetical protein [Bacillus thuringiensis]HDR4441284.1 hypothetical protein [Bacillus cereus]
MIVRIIEIIDLINSSVTMPDMAKELGVSKDTLRRRLNSVGYEYDNSKKKTLYVGEESEKNQIDNKLFSDLNKKNNRSGFKVVGNKSEKNQNEEKKVVVNNGKKSEKNQNEVINEIGKKSEKNQNNFTESEILALKELLHIVKSDEAKLFLELASLPESKESKKSSYIISKEIHEQFEEFAKQFAGKRISKFSLIELAMYEFMKKYS